MWTCPLCNQSFKNNQQQHSCNDKVLADCLSGKSAHTIELFRHFIREYNRIAPVTIHPTKTMIGIATDKRIAWVTSLGKDFVDIVFPFKKAYPDNLCFHKIAQVPGQQQYNHHFRMMHAADINEELMNFMRLALEKD